MAQFMVRMHQAQFKFDTNDIDNSRRPLNYWMMINMSSSGFNDGMKSAKTLTTFQGERLYGECIAPNSASASIFMYV